MRFQRKIKKSKKASIELSMNMVIIIILSVVILSFGIFFMNKIMSNSNALASDVYDDIDNNLASIMCDSSDLACLQPTSSKVGIGESRKFTLKIMNLDSSGTFKIDVSLIGAYESGGTNNVLGTDEATIDTWLVYDQNAFTIEPSQSTTKGIGIVIGDEMATGISTTKGFYNFAVNITRENPTSGVFEQYGRIRTIMLDVK